MTVPDQVFEVSSIGKLYLKSLKMFAHHLEDLQGNEICLEDLDINEKSSPDRILDCPGQGCICCCRSPGGNGFELLTGPWSLQVAVLKILRQSLVLIWHKSGSIHLTVVLCLLLAADLSYGFVCLSRRTILFAPLNDIGLMSWLMTYGRHNLAYTAWFFVLLGLLALLCINTFVCTTDRVVRLIRSRSHFTFQRLFFRFAPHLMH